MRKGEPFVATAVGAALLGCILCSALAALSARERYATQPGSSATPDLLVESIRDGQDVVGRKMPRLDFDRWLKTEKNKPLDTAGHVTLYRWWTDGCAHCEATLPAVEKLRRKYASRGLRVVAVYHPKPPREVPDKRVRAAAKDFGYAGPIAVDQDWSELTKFYLSTGDRPATSASFLVDRDGVIRLAHPGPRFYPSDDPADAKEDADYRAIDKAIDALLTK